MILQRDCRVAGGFAVSSGTHNLMTQDFNRDGDGRQWLESRNSVTRDSLEFAARGGLVQADATGGDIGLEVVFAFNGRTGEATEHSDLPDVG
jgi:hypothetical protein